MHFFLAKSHCVSRQNTFAVVKDFNPLQYLTLSIYSPKIILAILWYTPDRTVPAHRLICHATPAYLQPANVWYHRYFRTPFITQVSFAASYLSETYPYTHQNIQFFYLNQRIYNANKGNLNWSCKKDRKFTTYVHTATGKRYRPSVCLFNVWIVYNEGHYCCQRRLICCIISV